MYIIGTVLLLSMEYYTFAEYGDMMLLYGEARPSCTVVKDYYSEFLVLRRMALMLARGSGERLKPSDQSGNKPPSGDTGSYSRWLQTCRVHFALQIAVLPFPGVRYSTQHRQTCSLWNAVGDLYLFLALAISDWLLPRSPLHLRACRLPAIRIETHYKHPHTPNSSQTVTAINGTEPSCELQNCFSLSQ